MTLAFDIGNTNIKIALLEHEKIAFQWRISTDSKRTGDEYFSILRPLFRDANVNPAKITDAILSSVVPQLIGPFVLVTQHFTGKKPLVIAPDIYEKLPLTIPESAVYEIGTDLLCDALAAWETYHQAAIVVDFGTALSFTAVDQNANIAGIAIAPGLGTALKALFNNTAQLPSVSLEAPPSTLGKNTTWSIQAGIVLGYKGLVESMIEQMKNDLHTEYKSDISKIKVIATGGLNSMLKPITNHFDEVDKNLTIKGMAKALEYVKK